MIMDALPADFSPVAKETMVPRPTIWTWTMGTKETTETRATSLPSSGLRYWWPTMSALVW